MGANKSYGQIYRPMFNQRDSSMPLFVYTKKIEALRKAESADLVEEVHHPSAWH